MPTAVLNPPEVQPPRKHFTRSEVQQMLEAGMFAGQRFELINGELIDKMGQNPPHAVCVRLVFNRLAEIFGFRRLLIQAPIEVAGADRELSWPEPDVAVFAEAEAKDAHRTHHPRGDELALLIEVADSTLWWDTKVKVEIYARAGVPEYWVLDLTGRRLIVHSDLKEARYHRIEIFAEAGTVSVEAQPGSPITVDSLLP